MKGSGKLIFKQGFEKNLLFVSYPLFCPLLVDPEV